MDPWSDFDCEMHPVPLDLDTADRLLAGTVAPEDAPPGYANVARLLESAGAEPTAEELSRETEVVAMVAAAVRSSSSIHSVSSPRRFFMPFALSRPRMTAAFVAVTLACTAGLASAGSLPGAAQDVASAMLAKVGISVPGPNEHAGTHPSVRGSSGDASSDVATGSEIGELATTTDLTGVEKGAAISSAASDGKGQAGQHGSASAPVDTPNGGGTGTANTASGGKSSQGTSTGDTASGGASSAGSGNASSGEETADRSGGHSSVGADNGSSGQSQALETPRPGRRAAPVSLRDPTGAARRVQGSGRMQPGLRERVRNPFNWECHCAPDCWCQTRWGYWLMYYPPALSPLSAQAPPLASARVVLAADGGDLFVGDEQDIACAVVDVVNLEQPRLWAASPGRVLTVQSALTDAQRLARWIAEVEGDLRLGGAFQATFTSGWKSPGRVDACEPPRYLLVTMTPDGEEETVIEAVLVADGPDETRG